MSDNKHNAILKKLCEANVLTDQATLISEHKGATDAVVLEVHDNDRKIAIKKERPDIVERSAAFLKRYTSITFFPKVLFVADDASFYAYEFIEGTLFDQTELSEEVVALLTKEVINSYKHADTEFQFQWGFLEDPQTSLLAFLHKELDFRAQTVDEALNYKEIGRIKEIASSLFFDFGGQPYLVHGDLGVHNLIMQDEEIAGIVDPDPSASLPALELAFLICSKPHSFGSAGVTQLFEQLQEKSNLTAGDFLNVYRISLYIRIANCIWHHPADLPAYLSLYKNLVLKDEHK